MNTRRASDQLPPQPLSPHDVLHAVSDHPMRWMLPLVLCTTLGVLYAYLKPATWEATQALLVRDEAVGKAARPGRFNAVEEMKTAQETVLELIKSRTVLAAALVQVGPPADEPKSEQWPSDRTVEALEQAIKITPPKGAEFGKTEVFLPQGPSRRPAPSDCAGPARSASNLKSSSMTCGIEKYQGVIDELTKTVSLAQADLDASTEALIGRRTCRAGPDLAELRILNETPRQRKRSAASGRRDRNRTAFLPRIGQFEPGTAEAAQGRAGRSGPAAGQPRPAARIAAGAAAAEGWAGRCATAHGTTVGQHGRVASGRRGGPRIGTRNQPATAR